MSLAPAATIDLTAIASVIAAAITAIVSVVTVVANQRQAASNRRDDQFNAAVAALRDDNPRMRAIAVSTLVQFAVPSSEADPRYFNNVVDALYTMARFERDIYVNDHFFQALARLLEINSTLLRRRLHMLQENLQADLLRQIAEYAAKQHEHDADRILAGVYEFAPEGRPAIEKIAVAQKDAMLRQLNAERLLGEPPYNDRDLKWTIRMTGMKLAHVDRLVR